MTTRSSSSASAVSLRERIWFIASSVENESGVLSGVKVGVFGGGTLEDENDEAFGFICFFIQDSEWQVLLQPSSIMATSGMSFTSTAEECAS